MEAPRGDVYPAPFGTKPAGGHVAKTENADMRSRGISRGKLEQAFPNGRAYSAADSGEGERSFRREAERRSGLKPNTIGA